MSKHLNGFSILTRCPKFPSGCTCKTCTRFEVGDIVKSHIDPFADVGLVEARVVSIDRARSYRSRDMPYFRLRVVRIIEHNPSSQYWKIGTLFHRLAMSLWKNDDPNDIEFYHNPTEIKE